MIGARFFISDWTRDGASPLLALTFDIIADDNAFEKMEERLESLDFVKELIEKLRGLVVSEMVVISKDLSSQRLYHSLSNLLFLWVESLVKDKKNL